MHMHMHNPTGLHLLKVEGDHDSEQLCRSDSLLASLVYDHCHRKGLCSPGYRILLPSSTCCKRHVDGPASVCFCVKHTEAPFFCGLSKASCWNRVPLYVRNVCETHSHTQAEALTRTSERAGPAHAGVNQHAGPRQRIIHSVSASLQQVGEAPMHQNARDVHKKPQKAASAYPYFNSRGSSLLAFSLLTKQS